MIKYYDAEASSSSAELGDINTYKYGYDTNNSTFNNCYSEIIEDRFTTYKPREKKANRTRNREYKASETRNRVKNDELKRNEKVYNRRTVEGKNKISNKDEIRKRIIERKKNISRIIYIIICFSMLMLISYRYATVDASFRQKENLKKELASIQKENEQLKVNIEKQMNFNAIEQEAREKLGMQKLDNNQKIYVNLNKSDYIEPSKSTSNNNSKNKQEETWWCKLLKDLFKIEI